MNDQQTAETVGWLPLHIEGLLANTVEDISANISAALKRDYIPFNALIETKSGAVAIVGSGPSLKENWQQLLNFKGEIIACNAACQFLLEKGIVPTYMMCFDADPLMLEFITPHPDITYLLASRCPPKAFDMLDGCKIICWHALGDERLRELLEASGRMEPMIAGGSAAVTRSMFIAPPMGYTAMHLWGADSSHSNGDTHIRKSTTDERRIQILCNGRTFETSPWMCQQANDFRTLVPMVMDDMNIRVTVHGDGLIPHIAKEYGCRTDYETRPAQFVREWKKKARILWASI
jgi:hypothetical protein